jgi:hypothetical protein
MTFLLFLAYFAAIANIGDFESRSEEVDFWTGSTGYPDGMGRKCSIE